jgi:hypothetical protein
MIRSHAARSEPMKTVSQKSTSFEARGPGGGAQNVVRSERRAEPTHDQIARRAYEIYVSRGGSHGHHHDDWVQAERELKLGR